MEYLVAARLEQVTPETMFLYRINSVRANKDFPYPLADGLYIILDYGNTDIPHVKITRTRIMSLEPPEVQARHAKDFLEKWKADHPDCQ